MIVKSNIIYCHRSRNLLSNLFEFFSKKTGISGSAQTRLARFFQKNDFICFTKTSRYFKVILKFPKRFAGERTWFSILTHHAFRHIMMSFPPLADEEKSKQLSSHCSSNISFQIYVWKNHYFFTYLRLYYKHKR